MSTFMHPAQDIRAKADIAAAQTDSVIVAAVAGKKIRVLQYLVVGGAAATTVVFNSKGAGAGTAISPVANLAAGGCHSPQRAGVGWFETNAGEGLSATTGAGAGVGATVLYQLV